MAWPALRVADPLELADVLALRLLEPLVVRVQVALTVLERALVSAELGEARVEALLLGQEPLLDSRDLEPTLLQLEI